VTGASGFVGRHCLPALVAQGYEIHAVSSRRKPASGEQVNWQCADLLDPEQVERLLASVQPSHLLHLAWVTEPGKYWNAPENVRWVRASLDLVEAFARNGGQRVVGAGTCAEYDWSYGYCSEGVTPLHPLSLYGVCKHSLQMILSAFAARVVMSLAWGRLFYLYGPHEHPARLVPSVIRALQRGEPALCSHGNQIRDFLYVEDAATALVRLLDSDLSGPVNVASGYPVPLKRIISHIAETMQRPDLVRLGALPVSPDDPPLLTADVRRLSEGTGWEPRYDLDRGLELAIKWWTESADRENA
jgi:nucleoside-diphosphate-sugar epimerase